MLHDKRFQINLIAFGIVGVLAACGGGGDGDSAPVFYPEVPPGDVQVVGGDGNSSALANTISWAYDPAATDHIVYWDTDPNGTFSNVVEDTDTGRDYTIHSGTDVIAGKTIFYKVVATDGIQVSVDSEVVSATPQEAMTEHSLNDVAWNGLLDGNVALVAVGDSGVILNSPDGATHGWSPVDHTLTVESLAGVTWANNQFVVVGAGGTILTSADGDTDWDIIDWDEQNIDVSTDLEDVAWSWSTSEYIVVGKNGVILTGNAEGDRWVEQTSGIDAAITLEGVAVGNYTAVAVGTHGTIITSEDGGVSWQLVDLSVFDIDDNNALNDVTWDGTRFGVVGSDSIILSSPDGLNWTKHNPSITDYSLEGAVQWDASLPADPILAAVGSAGSFIYSADEVSGYYVPTGTNEQLEAITWIDIIGDDKDPYFLMVGHDGTVMTSFPNLD